MITIHRTTDYTSIKNILSNPVLFSCTYGQGDAEITEKALSTKEWLLIKDNDIHLGCFEIRDLTKITLEAHIYILPEYWKQSRDIVDVGHQWAKENHYKVIFTDVPENCTHIINFMVKMNYEACGQISNAVVYKGQLVTLFLFNKQL